MEQILFSESTVLNGIPEILAREPWVQARSKLRALEKKKFLRKISESQRYTNPENLPERLMDLFALDALLYQYRDTDPPEKKIEHLKKAFMLWSTAGTLGAPQMVADIFFEGAGTVREWFDYNGDPDHFRVDVINFSLPWSELRKFIEKSFYFRRLSQQLDEIRTILRAQAAPVHIGAAAIERHWERTRYIEKSRVYTGVCCVERHWERTILQIGV